MATCMDCLHIDACVNIHKRAFPNTPEWEFEAASKRTNDCKFFKDKSHYAEVKHGEWEIKTDEYDCEYMMCSVCKEEFYPVDADTVDTTPNYCPNCGAEMDGGKDG